MSDKKILSYNSERAEKEANEIAFRFAESSNPMLEMERTYGADFSNIKIHTDESADRKVKSAGKDALASGSDIFFGKGILDMKSQASRALLAHELAHTMQQGVAGGETLSEYTPEGTPQGGILDWFKKKYQNYRAKREGKAQKQTSPKKTDKLQIAREEAMQGFAPKTGQLDSRVKDVFQSELKKIKVEKDSNYTDLIRLGFGMSQSSNNLLEKGYRGSAFEGLGDDYKNYFQSLEDGNVDFTDIRKGMSTSFRKNNKKYLHGEKSSQITKDMLSMFGSYMESQEGLEYADTFNTGLKDLDFFASGENNSMDFVMNVAMKQLLSPVNKDLKSLDGTQKEKKDKKEILLESTRLLSFLPDMKEDEKQRLAPDVKELVGQYEALRNRIIEKIAARKEGKGTS